MTALPPGSTIGILGGGQLGRMMAIAAAQLGYHCHIYAPEERSVAAEVSAEFTCAGYHDLESLDSFAKKCAVITIEWENVPVDPLFHIKDRAPLYPPVGALEIAQNRISEKNFARDQSGVTAPFTEVTDITSLEQAIAEIGAPAILKTISMGYDGKGQARIKAGDDLNVHWKAVGEQPCVAEGFVTFSHEFSVILVRAQDGEIRFWDTPHNVHEDGILSVSNVPAPSEILDQQEEARALAAHMAQAINYVGVLTCEFFATFKGPVFNEMAPRVHNSGHWSIEGAITSQFENHIRAICGLPLGDTGLAAKRVEMHNLIGTQADDWQNILGDDRNHLHLYGKREAREGRKMGHVTKLFF
ncbi:5-(carboxyamino)imidazole ribonucleotide synthase [Parasphingorhabdus halotolerans]|uniref:N5-carboxyaminoimidazole ribonucleotide synthase n=1 Tax=Parasphingorhabdus halotolerans TaxID=2725558 RepID=A0A6H2DNR2_9SPHN|nr:5-(carboxyamino)imidazole ribonucleotide synthase [Parasphingorhabdus halotolerans]QJB69994.1 5-(carboxyamino)imidazole ribonucleotide synthase [Parasphingorhabdus halotolerans]